MKVIITIEVDNDAFQPEPSKELARILKELSDKISHKGIEDKRPLYDINGNNVGWLEVMK